MARRFSCEHCNEPIVVQHLKPGEIAMCKRCGRYNTVPENAEEIAEETTPGQQQSYQQSSWQQDQPGYQQQQTFTPDIGFWDFGDFFELTFRAFGKNFGNMIGITLLYLIPAYIIFGIIMAMFIPPLIMADNPALPGAGFIIFIIIAGLIITFIGQPLMEAAVSCSILGYYTGRKISIPRCYSLAWHKISALAIGRVIIMLVVIILSVTIIGLPVALFLGISWILYLPVALLEKVDTIEALRRSFKLIKENWWRIFGTLFAYWLMLFVVSIGASLIPFIGAFLISIFSMPILSVMVTHMYIDLRARKEGLTKAQLADEMMKLERERYGYGSAAGYQQPPSSS